MAAFEHAWNSITKFDEDYLEMPDLEQDPHEMHNCYHDEAYQTVVAQMTALLDAKMAEIGDVPCHDMTSHSGQGA